MKVQENLLNEERSVCSFAGDDLSDVYSFGRDGTRGDSGSTIQDGYVKILDFREGNEESPEETTGCKASVYEGFNDCTRAGKVVELLSFRHFARFWRFDRKEQNTFKKSISDGVNVSVVLNVECGNIQNCR